MALYYAGQRLVASDLNTICAKYKNANAQTGIASGTNTTIQVPTLVYNKGGGIITMSSSVLTLGKAGLYEFKGNFEVVAGTATLYGWIGHPTNSAAVDRYGLFTTSNRNGVDTAFCSGEREFAAGDQIAMRMWHNIGSNTQTIVTELETWFSVRYIHGT